MPIIQHGLDAQGRPRWVRERFDTAFYAVPPDWIARLRTDGRRPSVHELLDNDRGGPLDGMQVVRETVRGGKRFVVVFAGNTSPQFAVEIELDAIIADAEIRALPPEVAWEFAREADARALPPVELMPEPVRVLYDAARKRRVVVFRRDVDNSFGYEEQYFSPQSWVRDMLQLTPAAEQRHPKLWERAWQPSGGDTATRHETAEQALAEARANVAWLVEQVPDRHETDSLKLVDMMRLEDEFQSGGPLRAAFGDEEIFLDEWGLYERVFDERPRGSVSSRDYFQPESEGTFLLLRAEHVEQIIKALRSRLGQLRITTAEQLATLERWWDLSLANHRHMVAYIFNRGGGPDATAGGSAAAQGEASSGDTGTSEEDVEIKPGTDSAKRLEVETRGLQFAAVVLLGLFMVPLGVLLLIGELSKGARLAPARLAVGFAPLAAYGAVAWLFRRAHVRSVRYFSDEGLVRNDGRSFAWADLGRVVNRIRLNRVTGIKYVWRIEIQFKDGDAAWLLPTKIGNFPEVYKLVGSLPCEHTEVRA
jgi:hypothetical protein